MTHQSVLVATFAAWTIACLSVGGVFLRRAPAVSVALFGAVLGAIAGFFVGNADGPAEVPAYTAVGASVGLFVGGAVGLGTTTAKPPSKVLARAALCAVLAAPFAAAALTALLQIACPLYVTGKRAGFCTYQGDDLLGGWVSGVIVAFVCDALFVAIVFAISAAQARRRSVTQAVPEMPTDALRA
jgi:hypothetical protein